MPNSPRDAFEPTRDVIHPQVIQSTHYPMPVQPASPPAWLPDPQSPGILRYWDGHQWTDHRAAAPTPQPIPTPQPTAVVYNQVKVSGGGSSAGLHLVLTILTCGAWLPVWIIIEIIRAITR